MAVSWLMSMRGSAHVRGSDDDVRAGRVGVELVDERGAAREHRALVDRALVGHLLAIERQRLVEQDRALDAAWRCRCAAAANEARRSATRAARPGAPPTSANVASCRSGQSGRHASTSGTASMPTASRSVPGNHGVAQIRREVRDDPRAQRADVDPRAGRQLEVLAEPAVEEKPASTSSGIDEADGVADAVVAFLVECRGACARPRASSRA